VFLHPQSREEYALARTERKSGAGYTGFTAVGVDNCAVGVLGEGVDRQVTAQQIRFEGDVRGGFPVFLHPQSREEYALARTERKSGAGYTGFTCYAAVLSAVGVDNCAVGVLGEGVDRQVTAQQIRFEGDVKRSPPASAAPCLPRL
jgi:hypothetical protein